MPQGRNQTNWIGRSRPGRTIESVLRELPLVEDDLYLGMQAMNLSVVDGFLADWEGQLLRRYIDEERTPLPDTVVVSAFSQLWIFGLYEFLRTWRGRVQRVIKFADQLKGTDAEARQQLVEQKKQMVRRITESTFDFGPLWGVFMRAANNRNYVQRLERAIDSSEILFRRIEALRMSLAKHEVPRSDGHALAPGYGRIDMTDGSITWQVLLGRNELDMVSRRKIADECRDLGADRSRYILPKAIQEKIRTFPRLSYALKRVSVRLKDGAEVRGVLVYWNKIVVGVQAQPKIGFDARAVVTVEPDLNRPIEETEDV